MPTGLNLIDAQLCTQENHAQDAAVDAVVLGMEACAVSCRSCFALLVLAATAAAPWSHAHGISGFDRDLCRYSLHASSLQIRKLLILLT